MKLLFLGEDNSRFYRRKEQIYIRIHVKENIRINLKLSLFFSSGRLTFEEGEREASIYVTTLKDAVSEVDETFSVVLFNASNGAAISSTNNKQQLLIMANGKIFKI